MVFVVATVSSVLIYGNSGISVSVRIRIFSVHINICCGGAILQFGVTDFLKAMRDPSPGGRSAIISRLP
jgi:hypothetical protein